MILKQIIFSLSIDFIQHNQADATNVVRRFSLLSRYLSLNFRSFADIVGNPVITSFLSISKLRSF